MSDKRDPWASVLKVRLVIQNSPFHHNIKLQEHSQLDVKLVHFAQLPEVEIINSTLYSNTGTQTIILSRSKVIFQGQVVFQNNTSSTDGGALYLDESSLLQFNPDTRVAFINNTASQRRGAIYVHNMKKGGNIGCFFELDNVLRDSEAGIQVVFEGNRTEIAGDALYGGQVYLCAIFLNMYKNVQDFRKKSEHTIILYPNDVIKSFFSFTDKTTSYSLISSDPF